MPSSTGFCDLCINSSDPKILRQILLRLIELGYETVAINQTVDESVFEHEKKKKKGAEVQKSNLPELIDVSELKEEFAKKLTVLSRISYAFGDSLKMHSLAQSQILKNYDLFSVIPKSQAALQFACAQANIDMVTIKSNYPGLKFSRKLYFQAIERGVHFEIQYADVVDESTRKYTLHYSHLFHIFGKSRNVIISSGATNVNVLRSPYDIINLASLFGLDETKAKASVLGQCKYLLSKAEGRLYGKAVFAIHVDNSQTMDKQYKNYSHKRKKIKL